MTTQPATLPIRAALLMRPVHCLASDMSTPGVLLHLRDTTGLFADTFTARWMGAGATEFVKAHAAELIPGRCLDLDLCALRCFGHELRARVHSCTLAPLPPSRRQSTADGVEFTNIDS